jgi:hypothetical protein
MSRNYAVLDENKGQRVDQNERMRQHLAGMYLPMYGYVSVLTFNFLRYVAFECNRARAIGTYIGIA